jgi:hypothetical protein
MIRVHVDFFHCETEKFQRPAVRGMLGAGPVIIDGDTLSVRQLTFTDVWADNMGQSQRHEGSFLFLKRRRGVQYALP